MLFVYSRVKDFRDLVFGFGVKDDWRFRVQSSVRKLIWSRGFQHGDMKDGVNTSHRVGEVEGEVMEPTSIISKGPRYFSGSFLESW